MQNEPLLYTIFLIFTGAAVAATLALYARQALLVSYILLGMLFGPWGLGLVDDPELIRGIAKIGIIMLLFLLGLDLPLRKLLQLVGETTRVTGLSALLFALLGIGVGYAFGYDATERLLIGAALMFSSTIIGLKLLPTTILHHKRTGEIIVSILLLQDLIAILILLLLEFQGGGEIGAGRMLLLALALPGLLLLAGGLERWVLQPLIRRFDTIQEYIFLLAIGWCLGFAELAGVLGLSHEIGAFIAGVALAASPIALFIAESLKPLRDFFLIIFFFSLGAGFDLGILGAVFVPALLLAALSMLVKPLVFRFLLQQAGESRERAGEIGVRLGQISEFSLLIAVLAFDQQVIGREASYLVQAATLLTFIASSYFIVLRYPTPIAVSERLRRN
ncbi:cation:proton antiporter [Thiohalobacter sp. IOR34]|uniref:cation:proton antiporter domain-containing protein n=1 Tax=Thiohalobacter sp. IOR34 TaxID=3057176 RepID=UPI0025AEFBE5|nr:cation:proton antiporter [Thiohalobacter sp. IOR34]WJW76551.1 cation:proton antiporter [Thiohalobacter sp. IOR34]